MAKAKQQKSSAETFTGGVSPQREEVVPELALATVNPGVVYELMDALDAEIIIDELTGVIAESDRPLAYEFQSGGKPVRGLTIVGIQEAVRMMAQQARPGKNGKGAFAEVLRPIGKPDFEMIDLPGIGMACLCTMTIGRYVVDLETKEEVFLDSAVGAKAQAATMDTQYKGKIPDPFFIEKAQTKAERNGKRKLLRPDMATAVLMAALQEGKVERKPIGSAHPQGQHHQQRQQLPPTERPDPISNDVAWLQTCANAKKALSNDAYYRVLGSNGAEHANTVKDPKVRATILKELKDAYQSKQEHDQTQTAKTEGRPAESLFNREREPGAEG